jgi:flagellar basal-body rod modification protein FlgD
MSINQNQPSVQDRLEQQNDLHHMMTPMQDQEKSKNEFLLQLSQFGTHNEVKKIQESFQQITTSLQSNQALQASALVGRKILINSEVLRLGREGQVSATVDVVKGYTDLKAAIYSETGEQVKTITLDEPSPGFLPLNWDGMDANDARLKAGKYQIKVHAFYEGEKIQLKTMIFVNVNSVSLGQNGEGLKLNAADIGLIGLDEVEHFSK